MELLKLLAFFSHWNVGIRPFEASSSIYREGWLLAQVPPFTRVSLGGNGPPFALYHF